MKAQARAELKEQDKEGKLICDNWYRIDRLIVPQSTKTTRPVKEPYEYYRNSIIKGRPGSRHQPKSELSQSINKESEQSSLRLQSSKLQKYEYRNGVLTKEFDCATKPSILTNPLGSAIRDYSTGYTVSKFQQSS
jgi:hypothetical protein